MIMTIMAPATKASSSLLINIFHTFVVFLSFGGVAAFCMTQIGRRCEDPSLSLSLSQSRS